MMKKKQTAADGIVTSRLPLICPACAAGSPVVTQLAPSRYRVACQRCTWREAYRLEAKEAA